MRKLLLILTSVLAGISAVFVLGYLTYTIITKPTPLLSPLSDLFSPIIPTPSVYDQYPKPQTVVYGFLPYWNLKYRSYLRFSLLTHLAYFSVGLDTNGNISKIDEDGNAEPGYRHLRSPEVATILAQARQNHTKNIITITAMRQDIIEGILNPQNQTRAIANIISLVEEYSFDGINIDFEYVGTPDPVTATRFTLFIKTLNDRCHQSNPDCELAIDVFGDTGRSNRLWKLSELHPFLDHIFVMAYDYYRPSSTQAGPVAPLRGKCSQLYVNKYCLESDISADIAAITRQAPAQKVILGVPYYGYQWRTAAGDYRANTYEDTGGTASLSFVHTLINQEAKPINSKYQIIGIQQRWDDFTLTPYIVHEPSPGKIVQVYYENSRSLSLKYDLVNKSGLAGVGIWALGYDGDLPDYWELLYKYFSPPLLK